MPEADTFVDQSYETDTDDLVKCSASLEAFARKIIKP